MCASVCVCIHTCRNGTLRSDCKVSISCFSFSTSCPFLQAGKFVEGGDIYTYMCMYVCVYVYIIYGSLSLDKASLSLCLSLSVCLCLFPHTHTVHTHKHTHTHTHTHTHAPRARAHTHTHTHTDWPRAWPQRPGAHRTPFPAAILTQTADPHPPSPHTCPPQHHPHHRHQKAKRRMHHCWPRPPPSPAGRQHRARATVTGGPCCRPGRASSVCAAAVVWGVGWRVVDGGRRVVE